jgi:hypothetical protein
MDTTAVHISKFKLVLLEHNPTVSNVAVLITRIRVITVMLVIIIIGSMTCIGQQSTLSI